MSGAEVHVYVITISTQHPLEPVVSELQSRGLQVKQVLAALGQVIGEGSEEVAEKLRGLSAVESVDAQQQYRALDDDA
ncbi:MULTISPECIES: hypothetical protein [Glutamicibacter]|jgi:hypothetical protein|uniref:Ketohydroxyglutarate aldolase n=1 Tax=Glutamicibacter arilaitensis TaxID=256701 RepID=A0A4Y8TWP9_9MICC|nr:hypothetical protein [Glutamicibacter arilaitensis]TFH56258.1 hypothetical protein EXY26_04180 [Glutamicibacter arilaitensis]